MNAKLSMNGQTFYGTATLEGDFVRFVSEDKLRVFLVRKELCGELQSE